MFFFQRCNTVRVAIVADRFSVVLSGTVVDHWSPVTGGVYSGAMVVLRGSLPLAGESKNAPQTVQDLNFRWYIENRC